MKKPALLFLVLMIPLASCGNSGEVDFTEPDSLPVAEINNMPAAEPEATPVIEQETALQPETTAQPVPEPAQSGENNDGETPALEPAAEPYFSSAEEAYYYKYRELAEEYGTRALTDVDDRRREHGRHSFLSGVCVVNFLDFNGDNIQDLFIVYSTGQTDKLVRNNNQLEILDYPKSDSYQMEIWTYKGLNLIPLLPETSVSLIDYQAYASYGSGELLFLLRRFFITVFENADGFPVIQILNTDGVTEILEYENIYYSGGGINRDKFSYNNGVFKMNGLEIAEDIWFSNITDYNKILLSAFLADFGHNNSSVSLYRYSGIDYNFTLLQTEKVLRELTDRGAPQQSGWFVADGEYISLYLEKAYRSNIFFCELEEENNYDEKFYTDHCYALYDIDKNGVPELILYENSFPMGTHYHFYTIIDGELVYCGDLGRTILYSDGGDGLAAYIALQGGYWLEDITLDDNKILAFSVAAGSIWGKDPTVDYPSLEDFGYHNYEYLPFTPADIPIAFYTYNQEY